MLSLKCMPIMTILEHLKKTQQYLATWEMPIILHPNMLKLEF